MIGKTMKSTNHYNKARRSPKSKPNQMTAKEGQTKLWNIPVEVVIEILSWLPFKNLQRFKCVCKLWLCVLTDDPYFGKLHCKRVMECDYGIYSIDCCVKGNTFSQAVYDCFYGNHRTYSIRNFILRLRASGFVRWQWPIYGDMSLCNGLYIITHKGSTWFNRLWRYNYLYGRSSTLVLAPTTKAVQHVMGSARYVTHVCVDGNSVLESQLLLLSGKMVLIGTPNCVFEIFPRHSIGPECIKEFVLYNADELFARGFKDKVYDIFKLLPRKVKLVLISEWMPREAFEIPQQFWNQKERQWNTDTLPEAPEKMTRSSRSLWLQQSIELRHEKENAKLKPMSKQGTQRKKMLNS